ncbi:MAG: cadherin domain-containing protein [Fibrobacter sp.]|nr:cadherin domain-containing protein [Fibrobacter sp.]
MKILKNYISRTFLPLMTLLFAGSAFAADVAPLYFEGVDEDSQQQYWEDLMKYKLWGTVGINFNKGNVIIAEVSGFNGTASGDIIFNNGQHTIGGPLLVGGNLNFSTGNTSPDRDTLLMGPARVLGNVGLASWYNAPSTVYEGDYCVKGDVVIAGADPNNVNISTVRWMANVKGDVYAPFAEDGYEKCPAEVPNVDVHLTVPKWDVPAGVELKPVIMTDNVDGEVFYLDVPPILDTTQKIYDEYLSEITLAHTKHKYLYIRMPSGAQNADHKDGRLSRFYVENGINIDASVNSGIIQVVYVNPEATWNSASGSWENFIPANATYVTNKQYAGNVLFYTNKDIVWDALIEPSYQGTFMTSGSFTIKDHFVLAGQLVADSLHFESDITGDFRYVPFDPPILDLDPTALAQGTFPENNEDSKVPIKLSEKANSNVYFNYCFDLDESTASLEDFNVTELAKLPLCLAKDTVYEEDSVTISSINEIRDSGIVKITAGHLYPDSAFNVYINVAADTINELPETLHFKVFNLSGAVLPGNKREGYFELVVANSNNPPLTKDAAVVAQEDSAFTFKSTDFYYESTALAPVSQKGIVIQGNVNNGALLYKGDTVKVSSTKHVRIPVDSIGDLQFVAVKDKYDEEEYASFNFAVEDVMGNVSGSATISIAVTPVNDPPSAKNTVFTVDENTPAGETLQGAIKVFDVDDDEFVYTFDPADVNFALVDSLFAMNPATGVITIKDGVVLDYEKMDKTTIEIKAIVSDKSASTGKVDDIQATSLTLTIVVNDVNEMPTLADQKFAFEENKGKGYVIGSIEYGDLDTAVALTNNIVTAVRGDTALFNVSAEGVITAKKDFDFEKDSSSYTLIVQVADAHDPKLSVTKTMTITLVNVNETPTLADQKFNLEENSGEGFTVGTIVAGDLDKAVEFTKNNVITAVGGDTAVFTVSSDGVIKTRKDLDFEKDPSVYTLTVAVTDTTDPTLTVTKTMTITLENVNEMPTLEEQKFAIPENSGVGATVGTVETGDLDDSAEYTQNIVTAVGGDTDVFYVTPEGVIMTRKDLDYEKDPLVYTLEVAVTDATDSALTVTKTITINLENVNENPVIITDKISVKETAKSGTVVDTLKATDVDAGDTNLTFKLTEPSKFFELSEDGVVTVKDGAKLDYETNPTEVLVVEVSDGHGGKSTKKVTVSIDDVKPSDIKFTEADNADSSWKNPDVIYTNLEDMQLFCSFNGAKQELCVDTTLTEGKNVIIKVFDDPELDGPAADTVIVYLSTAAPIVTVEANADSNEAGNIYTIVEGTDAKDTNIYVNSTKNDIKVSVKDPVNGKDSSFVVKLDLGSVDVPSKSFETMKSVVKDGPVLNENPSSGMVKTPVNGTDVKVSYAEKIGGVDVVISYDTDNDGEVRKTAVVNAKGKVDSVEIITVSYTTKVDGKDVVVSYKADGATGAPLSVDSNGKLYSDSDTKETGLFSVTYDYVDATGKTVTVSYAVDEKGNMIKNGSGDIGYSVSYTFTNKYGNSATQSVFIVLDQAPPKVEILSPVDGAVIRANFVEVVWTVDGVEQDTLTLQGLEKGFNSIVRFYKDKAGNEASDTIFVIMKDGKDIEVSVVNPVTEMDQDRVDRYYASNPPKEGETFAVSIKNPTTGKEVETLIGGSFDTKDGSGAEPYPGHHSHLGPTLAMDVKLPVVNSIGGLATLDDLIGPDGLVALEGVDAKGSRKVSVEKYASEYCDTKFDYKNGFDKASLYDTKMKVHVWIYTTLGNFVDYYSFTQPLNDPDFTNEAGLLQMFFEMKPDKDGNVRAESGKLYATGAYLYKVEVDIRSKLHCTLPPVDDASGKKKGDVVKTNDDLLKPFGYKRPSKK